MRLLEAVLLCLAAVFFALHYVHLAADFPNFSPWMDWSKYTDEGWYGDAAIRYFQWGHWYVAGDFNPATALPVWPFLEGILFQFTGVSLIAARALTVTVFEGILVCSWLLLRRWRPGNTSLAPATAVFLLAVSPFCFVFTRLAILEPLLILLMLLALLFAGRIGEGLARLFPVIGLGVLIPAMILTKTTALFLLPSIFWLVFAGVEYRPRRFVRVALPVCGLALALWLLWMGLILHGHYMLDYRYLFSANGYTQISRANALSVLHDTFADGMWMGKIFFPAAMLAVAVAAIRWRRLRDYPLVPALLLWAAGYTAFLAYHNNLQPRYYLVVAVPLTLLLPVMLELWLLGRLGLSPRGASLRGVALAGAAILIGAIGVQDAAEMFGYLRHPEYTLVRAARQLHQYIAEDRSRDSQHSPLVLSISGSNLSLMTGLHSINDDFGTLELVNRVGQYRPGWYAAWNQIDDDKMEALAPYYRVERVATFSAMDDPDRNQLVLYRLNDETEPTPPRRPSKPVPLSFRAKVGQEPSTIQRKH
ncbi:hypothetical protein FTO74_12810 [Granulicella sp. WH15]|nr:hypothetical protein FTO74_12810 [Granulicella sp. WH15]